MDTGGCCVVNFRDEPPYDEAARRCQEVILKQRIVSIAMLILLAAIVVACGGEASVNNPNVPADHIQVQHILIGFKDAVGFQGSPPPKAANRTQAQAKTLAYDLLNQAKSGADYDKLVADNTDDSPPGIYGMANTGVQPAQGEYSRAGMVPAFGNVGFSLKVGEIGMADYDPTTSPFGYHIIKRIK
jgi:hypothetical protein